MSASDGGSTPDTIVLIHGLWTTALSWEKWQQRFAAQGYTVLTPTFPGLEVGIEALRADPSPVERLSMPDTVDHLEALVRGLEVPPVIMGHSIGGLLTQILLDRGLGAAGVAIDSVPAEGVHVLPPSQIKATFPVLNNPAKRKQAVSLTPDQFHYAFTNTLSKEESLEIYERHHIPAPGRWIWDGVLANLKPGHQGSWVNFKNNDRAPLLFIAGGEDHIMPPAINKSNANKYRKSTAVTGYREFPGRTHWTLGQEGWEEVADFALSWALEHGAAPRPATASG